MPAGSAPVSASEGLGKPVVVTVKLEATEAWKFVALALVMAGASFTVSVKGWLALGGMPFEALMWMRYVPPVPTAGVPARVACEPDGVKATPAGSVPFSL